MNEVHATLIAELENTWYTRIPITKAMQAKVQSFDGNVLVVEAALEPNINLHGTAFAGSLYTVSALTGWSMVHLQTRLQPAFSAIRRPHSRASRKPARPVSR